MHNILLRIARTILQSVIQQIVQQKNAVDMVKSMADMSAQAIPGIWQGPDAEAFLNEVKTRLIPKLIALAAEILGVKNKLESCSSIMDRADSNAATKVRSLRDEFSKI